MKRFLCAWVALILVCMCSPALAGIPTPNVGDTVFYGSYEQDNDLTNGKEPLEWIVLEVEDGKAWLLTKYCIEVVIFYPERVPMYWGITDLRAWMNGEFYETTFTDEEKAGILTTTVKNENPHGMKGAGDDTEDKIYLLSKDEVMRFFPECEDRKAYPTPYALAQGCTVGTKPEGLGCARWWTRTTGARKMDMWGIRVDGRMTAYGMQDVDWPGNTMRPVMWVQCDE